MPSEYVQTQIEQAAAKYFSCPEAEENILRRMFKQKGVAEDVVDELSGQDFSDINLGRLFSAIKLVVLDGGQVDFATVDVAFTKRFPKSADKLREIMADLVISKPYTIADGQSIEDHIKIVKDLSVRRKAMRQLDDLVSNLRDPTKDINETLSDIQNAAANVDSDDVKWMPLSEVNQVAFEYLEQRTQGKIRAVPSGITAVDNLIGGFFGGELTIIAARPATGKSAFGLNIALAAAHAGFKVGFVSCEMSDVGFGQRTLSRGSWVAGSKLRTAAIDPEEWDKLSYALIDMGDLPVDFMFAKDNPGRMNVENVVASVRKRARRGEIDLLIVDYIGILQSAKSFKEDRYRIAYVSSELKRLSQVADIPVIALCQVNRDAHGQMPTMAQLRDSGAIEQDADGIIFLHRPENHEDKSINAEDVASFYAMQTSGQIYISIAIAKQRNGQIGATNVLFSPETMRYIEILRSKDVNINGDQGKDSGN